MKREKLKLLMALLLLAAAWVLSKEGAVLVSQMNVLNPRKNGDFCVVIDPGHGGSDPGKVSVDGTEEKDINLAISIQLRDLLEAQDVAVHMTRETDTGLYGNDSRNKKAEDLQKRCELINRIQPDCVISIHQNSYHEQGVDGAQTFYYKDSEASRRLSELIQDSLVARLDPANHRMEKSNDSYYMLKNTSVPIVIVECGFLSDPAEAALLIQEAYQRKAAWAIHLGVLNYLNEVKKP